MSMRHTEIITLAKTNGLLFRPLGINSFASRDGFDQYIIGQDFKLTPEGTIEWTGDEKLLGNEVVVCYER